MSALDNYIHIYLVTYLLLLLYYLNWNLTDLGKEQLLAFRPAF